MRAVDWVAVVLAGAAAALVLHLLERREGGMRRFACLSLVMLVASAMLGHALARIGAERLMVKPWLYLMQAGGLAGAFVVPTLLISGVKWPRALGWLAAYLAMGGVFWLLS